MGFGRSVVSFGRRFGLMGSLFLLGCQTSQPGIVGRMNAHSAAIDFSGLLPAVSIAKIDVRASIPHYWEPQPVDVGTFFTHTQWRSPTKSTAVGVAAIKLPLPMSAKALVWFARQQYSNASSTWHKSRPRALDEWSDDLGREWFEGENDKYHVRGYVVTNGFHAWVIYCGYRRRAEMKPAELSLALRCIDSVVPLPLAKDMRVKPQ